MPYAKAEMSHACRQMICAYFRIEYPYVCLTYVRHTLDTHWTQFKIHMTYAYVEIHPTSLSIRMKCRASVTGHSPSPPVDHADTYSTHVRHSLETY